jgi:hypothetical protein
MMKPANTGQTRDGAGMIEAEAKASRDEDYCAIATSRGRLPSSK